MCFRCWEMCTLFPLFLVLLASACFEVPLSGFMVCFQKNDRMWTDWTDCVLIIFFQRWKEQGWKANHFNLNFGFSLFISFDYYCIKVCSTRECRKCDYAILQSRNTHVFWTARILPEWNSNGCAVWNAHIPLRHSTAVGILLWNRTIRHGSRVPTLETTLRSQSSVSYTHLTLPTIYSV